jgi:hypothetical protein
MRDQASRKREEKTDTHARPTQGNDNKTKGKTFEMLAHDGVWIHTDLMYSIKEGYQRPGK